jgi:outer membrane murein-binding lipoprotein Lpp
MHPLLSRSTIALAVVLAAGVMNSASAQNAASGSPDLKARCDQLISYYDRYGGTGRSENSDGQRNHVRIGASIDCQNGHYAQGVAAMEALLKEKKFDVPPATDTGVAQTPVAPLRPHGEARHNSQQ